MSETLAHLLVEGGYEASEMEMNQTCPAHVVLAALDQTMAWFPDMKLARKMRINRAEIRQEIIAGLKAKAETKA